MHLIGLTLIHSLYSLADYHRRIAASIGAPAGINDQDIEVEMPSSSFGFQPPSALNVHIRISQTLGEIMLCKSSSQLL
jgi:hypothetical protein